MNKRISEEQLILPTLLLLSLEEKKTLTTSQLIQSLEQLLQPTGEDMEILEGRNDTKFSQKVRNLVSHHTLDEKNNFATYQRKGKTGSLTISNTGMEYLSENLHILKYLLTNDFDWDDIKTSLENVFNATTKKQKIDVYDENVVIEEGTKKYIETNVYKRSSYLRDKAIEKFTIDSQIICDVCSFNFARVYGNIGNGFIEIHHIKPIVKFAKEEQEQFLKDALNNVAPVCSNCHRMIHRKRKKILTINQLRSLLQVKLNFIPLN